MHVTPMYSEVFVCRQNLLDEISSLLKSPKRQPPPIQLASVAPSLAGRLTGNRILCCCQQPALLSICNPVHKSRKHPQGSLAWLWTTSSYPASERCTVTSWMSYWHQNPLLLPAACFLLFVTQSIKAGNTQGSLAWLWR